ncbi:MAG: amidohydrolase family protein, partial [Rhodanobacteraceae bacterium]
MLLAEHLWTADGWQSDVRIEGASGGELRARFVLPGMPNLHSHAFQRAMAGLAERRGPDDDSFWTWRETMYAFASRIGPDELRAIAAQLYVEMLKAGYTHVCEFHYLHNAPDGTPYADPAAMSQAIIDAAREACIGLTLLPVLYMTGGFDGRALNERQRRFGLDVDAYLGLLERLRALQSGTLRVGVALHSLRAVPPDAMRAVLDALGKMPAAFPVESTDVSSHPPSAPSSRDALVPRPRERGRVGVGGALPMPIHIHIAEQIGEVQDCLNVRGARPVQWLLDNAAVDAHWCLVHA